MMLNDIKHNQTHESINFISFPDIFKTGLVRMNSDKNTKAGSQTDSICRRNKQPELGGEERREERSHGKMAETTE